MTHLTWTWDRESSPLHLSSPCWWFCDSFHHVKLVFLFIIFCILYHVLFHYSFNLCLHWSPQEVQDLHNSPQSLNSNPNWLCEKWSNPSPWPQTQFIFSMALPDIPYISLINLCSSSRTFTASRQKFLFVLFTNKWPLHSVWHRVGNQYKLFNGWIKYFLKTIRKNSRGFHWSLFIIITFFPCVRVNKGIL